MRPTDRVMQEAIWSQDLILGKILTITVKIDDPGTGTVRINSIVPQKYPFYGAYFQDPADQAHRYTCSWLQIRKVADGLSGI